MKHFPARTVPAQIGAHLADEITRASRKQLLASIAQSALCGLIGLLFGVMLALGYLADAPAWLR